jgi:hypothetical protein
MRRITILSRSFLSVLKALELDQNHAGAKAGLENLRDAMRRAEMF